MRRELKGIIIKLCGLRASNQSMGHDSTSGPPSRRLIELKSLKTFEPRISFHQLSLTSFLGKKIQHSGFLDHATATTATCLRCYRTWWKWPYFWTICNLSHQRNVHPLLNPMFLVVHGHDFSLDTIIYTTLHGASDIWRFECQRCLRVSGSTSEEAFTLASGVLREGGEKSREIGTMPSQSRDIPDLLLP